jgi:regulator of sigma E protease
MSWALAFVGFAVLIVLHEFGHFIAAKAVGMRVERFSLFFGPMLLKFRRGETEYGIAAIPLGGYVKISGMNPHEELPPEVAHRAYYRQKTWKRIVVISAGPAMNILVAFVLLFGIYIGHGKATTVDRVDQVSKGSPAATVLRAGDKIVAVDGVRGDPAALRKRIASHGCAGGVKRDGCVAATPAVLTVSRGDRTFMSSLRPRYSAEAERPLVGVVFGVELSGYPIPKAAETTITRMWEITTQTVSALGRVFISAKARNDVSGVVGSYEATRQSFDFDTTQALFVLALISLSLAIVNLFPFLPLDGGHIFWAVAEKIRGRPIPFSVLERAGVVGFVLIIMLFAIGLSNDIGRLRGAGFGLDQ